MSLSNARTFAEDAPGRLPFDYGFSSSPRRNESFDEYLAERFMSHTPAEIDDNGPFDAFGAFDRSFDEEKEVALFMCILKHGSNLPSYRDASVDNKGSDDNATQGHNFNSSVETPSLSQRGLPTLSPFSLQASADVHDEQAPSQDIESKPLSLSDILAVDDLIADLSPSAPDEDQSAEADEIEKKIIEYEEKIRLSPLLGSSSSESTRADSLPFPLTPSDDPHEENVDDLVRLGPSEPIVEAPMSPNKKLEAQSPADAQLPEYVSGELSDEPPEPLDESGSSLGEEREGERLSSAERALVAAEQELPIPELPHATPIPDPRVIQLSESFPDVSSSNSSNKRKRASTTRPTSKARLHSNLPSHRKKSLRIRVGRAPGPSEARVEDVDVEAESRCGADGADGEEWYCHFPGPEGGNICGVELPKDSEPTRTHLNAHIDHLQWAEEAQRNPNWRPTCPWCGKCRTKLQQLVRHILDTHLRMFVRKCACGGSYTRSNQKNNTNRHEESAKHRAYLQGLVGNAVAGAVEPEEEGGENGEEVMTVEDEDEEQTQQQDAEDVLPEFVQGSSSGRKRRRLR